MADELKTTVIVMEVRHRGELPADLMSKLEQRAYDYCNVQGVVIDPMTVYPLPIKEMS